MKCPYCGQEHPDRAKFCPTTGLQFNDAASNPPPAESNPFAPRKNNPVFIAAIVVGVFLLLGGALLIGLRFLPLDRLPVPPAAPTAAPTAALPAPTGEVGSLPTTPPLTPTQAPAVPEPTDPPAPTATIAASAVSSWQQGKLIFPQRSGRLNALYQLDLSASGAPTLLYDSGGSLLLTAPNFSPGGDRAAFNFYQGDLYVMGASGSGVSRLAACGAPSWSPDGRQVICAVSGEFWILDADSGAVAQQIAVPSSARFPTWSPAGSEIAYVTIEQGQTSIWRMALSGGQPVMLAGSASENYAPSWSPDGQRIAFQSNLDSANSEIWVMDRDGGNLRRVTDTPAGYWSRAPSFSPDGKSLAYVSDQDGSVGADYGEVFAVSLASGEVKRVARWMTGR